MEKEKPDNVADSPAIMPYGTNIGAPSIKPDDVAGWKRSSVEKVNRGFISRFEELKKEYENLAKTNQAVKIALDNLEQARQQLNITATLAREYEQTTS